MLKALDILSRVAGSVLEFFHWREDWNRTWSPVSFWLAVVLGATLVAWAIFFGSRAWDQLRMLISASS